MKYLIITVFCHFVEIFVNSGLFIYAHPIELVSEQNNFLVNEKFPREEVPKRRMRNTLS